MTTSTRSQVAVAAERAARGPRRASGGRAPDEPPLFPVD